MCLLRNAQATSDQRIGWGDLGKGGGGRGELKVASELNHHKKLQLCTATNSSLFFPGTKAKDLPHRLIKGRALPMLELLHEGYMH